MSLKTVLACIAASASLVQAQNGPYSIRYHNSAMCSTLRNLGCNRYYAFECCDAPPPGPDNSFPFVQATSGREEVGLLLFAEDPTPGGGCGGECTDVGQLSIICYGGNNNNPFNTVLLVAEERNQCERRMGFGGGMRDELAGGQQRWLVMPMDQRVVVECKAKVPINLAGVDGQDYHVTDENREALLKDFMALMEADDNELLATSSVLADEFATRWAAFYIGPTSD